MGLILWSRGNLRPNWSDIYLDFAEAVSKRSTCERLQVGCVVTTDDFQRVLAIGYNGNWAQGPNSCDSKEPGNCGCFPQNVLVTTKNGQKKIQDISVGDQVLTHLGRYRPVTEVLTKESAERNYAFIRYPNGRFISTIDHPILVKNDITNTTMWTRADQIKVGDKVLVNTVECRDCSALIPVGRVICRKCFKNSSKTIAWRKRASERMKNDNPMKRMYTVHKIDNERVDALVKKQKQGQQKLSVKLFEKAKQIEETTGFKAVVVDHVQQRPDMVLIDWNTRRVIAYEYEKMKRNVKHDKYKNNAQYDDVIWFVENNTEDDDFEIINGFACVQIKSVEFKKQSGPIYNLEVKDDHSYVCQNMVVHNCLHAEINAMIKFNPRDAKDAILFCTDSPCVNCAKVIINSGIKTVRYRKPYRDLSGVELLRTANVRVELWEKS